MGNKYRIIEQLGEGGTARVFLAVMLGAGDFSKLVVLKVPRRRIFAQASARNMFLAEARLSARLNHPNIVEVYEVIEQDGLPVMVMQYLDGQSLAALRRVAGTDLDLASHLSILESVLAGLHGAHTQRDYDGSPLQVVHRDVSPQNVMITADGQVKVLDFGIAKSTTPGDSTEIGTIKGKLAYMSPEQLKGGAVDHRADLFCVGIMLWEAATGSRYWGTASEPEILGALCSNRLPHRTCTQTIPEGLSSVVERALAPDPQQRYATGEEFRRAIEAYRHAVTQNQSHERILAELLERHFSAKRQDRLRKIENRVAALAKEFSDDGSSLAVSVPPGVSLTDEESETVLAVPISPARGRNASHPLWRPVGVLAVAVVAGGMSLSMYRMQARSGATLAAASKSDRNVVSPANAPSQSTQKHCGPVPKAHGKKPIIDDFNKQDQVIDNYDDRVGEWYAFQDGSGLPPRINLEQTDLSLVLHVSGGPYDVWGGGVGAALNDHCPYDASVYHGIRVVARGQGSLWLKVLTDENVVPPLGVCLVAEELCHDTYQAQITLEPNRWQVLNFPWSSLHQRGFGRAFRFNPARINHVQFEWREHETVDAYIDVVTFY